MKTTFLIFGITGDLGRRKLLPALHDIVELPEGQSIRIVGVSRRQVDITELITSSTGSDRLVDMTSVVTMNVAELQDYQDLKQSLAVRADDQLIVYLSVPPSAAADIADFLGQVGLNTPNVKIMFEKPFGFDLESAKEFIQRTGRYFSEAQIYRIDHYMAKEVALELVRLRTDPTTPHHAWSNKDIARIEVVASESIGVEGRADFYEQTGALRDVIQGHLFQLLSLVLMDTSGDFHFRELPIRRLEALRQLGVADPQASVRAQYKGYGEEVGNPGSRTETYAAVTLFSQDPRWSDVDIQVIAGKSLSEKKTAMTVFYKDGTRQEFIEGAVRLGAERLKDGYERVILDAMNGEHAIFTTSPEIIRAWEVLASIQQAWAMEQTPLTVYAPGAAWQDVAPNHSK